MNLMDDMEFDELQLMRRSAQIAAQATTPEEAAGRLLTLLTTAVQATSVRICSWDADTHLSTILSFSQSLDASIIECALEPGSAFSAVITSGDFFGEEEASGVYYWRSNQEDLPDHARAYMQAGAVQSLLLLPVFLQQRYWGHAEIWDTQRERPFTPQQVAWCQFVVQQAATLLYSDRVTKSENQRRREAATLQQVSTYLVSTLDREEVLQRTVDTIRQYLANIHACVISIYDPVTQQLKPLAQWRSEDRFDWTSPESPTSLEDDYASQVALSTKQPFAISDLEQHPFTNDWLRSRLHDGIRAVFCVPLMANRFPVGVLQIFTWYQPRVFTEEEITICQGVANQAAVAIENARLHRQTRQQAVELSILHQLAVATAATMDVETLLQQTTELIASRFYNYSFGFVMLNETGTKLRTHSSYHGISDEMRSVEIPLHQSVVGKVAQTGEIVVIDDVQQADVYFQCMPDTRSEIAAPLKVHESVIGVINVESRRVAAFSQKDVHFLTTLAGHVATAVERAQLYHTVRKQAATLAEQVAQRTTQLQQERDRTMAILESAGEGILLTDVDANIVYANPAIEKQSGYRREELLRQTPHIFADDQASSTVYTEMWQALAEGADWCGEATNRHKDGFLYDVSMTVTPLRDSRTDEVVGFVSVHSDITRLKELDRLKSRFVSNVTHELRTPLTNIRTYLSLLERGKPEKHGRYMQVLHEETERLTRLIQDLLDLSRFEMSDMRHEMLTGDFLKTARNLLEVYKPMAEKKRIQLTAVLPDLLPPVHISDPHLEKVLANLLSNALAYTPVDGRVSVTVERRPDHVSCSIADNGPGIPEADLPQIFERFFRGANAQKHGVPGTGLGLPMTKMILERYGGSITVQNLPLGGACFSFTLPLAAS